MTTTQTSSSSLSSRPFLVGVCGSYTSDKTSTAKLIFKYIGTQDCLLFSMDNYYKGPRLKKENI